VRVPRFVTLVHRSLPVYSSAMAKDAKAVSAWDFERIIPCHGVSTLAKSHPEKFNSLNVLLHQNTIEKDAKKAWDTAYARFLSIPDPTPAPTPAPVAEIAAEISEEPASITT